MAKDKLTDYNATATLNTDIGGINIDEGMLPSNVNNAMREQMSHLADFAAGTTGINVLNLQDDDASASIKIQAPAAVTTTTTLTLPDGAGSANQSLTTNGSGTLSWSTRIGNVVEDTTPQLGGNLDTNGNDITFGDNAKATFGDAVGGDLQIYHNPAQGSFIEDAGAGNLILKGTSVVIDDSSGARMATFIDGGAVTLNHGSDASARLATTSGGINVTGTVTADGLTIDGDIFVNDATPTIRLNDTDGTQTYSEVLNAGTNMFFRSRGGLSSHGGHIFARNNGTADTNILRMYDTGDIAFMADNGTTQGLYWDADQQRLGLGTTTPSTDLDVLGGIRSTSSGGYNQVTTTSIGDAVFNNNGNAWFTVKNGVPADAMRIDSSGNLLVGKTNTASNVVGAFILNNGLIRADVDGGVVNVMNRKTSDGDVAVFQKDGATVGSIGTNSSTQLFIGGSGGGADAGLAFYSAGTIPTSGTGASTDGSRDLGASSSRFRDLYLSGGVYLGGTGAANKLNDYEEGTWTINNNSDATGVISSEEGFYKKIGNQVTVYGQFVVSTNFTSPSIGGLPFNVANLFTISIFGATGVVIASNLTAFDTITVAASEGGDLLTFREGSGAEDNHAPNTTNDPYRFVITYMTA